MDPDAPDPTREGDAEAIFAEFLELERAGYAPDLEQLCERHPEHADELRRRHHQWRMAGTALERLKRAQAGPEEQSGDRAEADPEVRARAELLWARYTVQGEIGRGGMGYILGVRDEGLGRDLAMKVLRGKGGRVEGVEEGPTRKDERARFLVEARITGRLEHPGIVPVHELGHDPEGKPYFTMKLVAGRTFKEILPLAREEREDWNVQRALGVLLKVCEAVGFAHDKGVIHRDLKPANLMVGSFGEVYVMDWGLARDMNRPEPEPKPEDVMAETDTHDFRTMDGDVIGTPEYMSPEQAIGKRDEVGPLSDVFAVGAMLYELLCGRAPHGVRGSSSPVVRLAAAIGSNHEPVQRLAPDAPAELCAICERALAPDPDQRYASMVGLGEDLRAYLEGRVVQAHATGAWQEAKKWVQRNRPLAASLAVAVLLLIVGLVTALHLRDAAQANFELAEERREEAQENLALAKERREQAEVNFALAERRREEVESLNKDLEFERSSLAAEIESVKRLSALQDYDELLARVDELWPAHPENIASYEEWIGEAQALVADLPLHHAKRNELRAVALAQSESERESDRITHPDLARLSALPDQIAARRAALVQRRDGVAAEAFEPEWSALPTEARALMGLAYSMVRPDRETFGREPEGVALAERALALAEESGDSALMAAVGDTLAWAFFAVGRDEEAREACASALEAAIDAQRMDLVATHSELKRLIEVESSEAGLAVAAEELIGLEAELTELEVQVDARRSWSFAETEAGREARWWHANLTRLISALEGMQDEATGLLSVADDAVSVEHGWSLPRRLALAERLRDGIAPGGEWSDRWAQAAAAIAAHPAYGGLELSPQTGLVPIGTDPDSGLWEFWHVATGEEPRRGEDGKLLLTEEMGLVLVLIPPGSFWMGASADPGAVQNYDPQAKAEEGPVHEVTMSAYFLSKYEMTQGQWLAATGDTPSGYTYKVTVVVSGLLHPVESVAWTDCVETCALVGLQLPSEAQWEYGARAGTDTPWYLGADREALRGKVNLADKTAALAGAPWPTIEDWPDNEDGGLLHVEVGFRRYPPNAFGLHEVHGNVLEFCADGFDLEAYRREGAVDPLVPAEASNGRVARGGSFDLAASSMRLADRYSLTPEFSFNNIGLRPARGIAP